MNPNAALAAIRRMVDELLAEDESMDTSDRCDLGAELAEHVAALDRWITIGGFLPDGWKGGK